WAVRASARRRRPAWAGIRLLPSRSASAHPQSRPQHLPIGTHALKAQRPLASQNALGPFEGHLPAINRQQKNAQQPGEGMPISLVKVAQFALVVMDMLARTDLVGTCAAVMYDPRRAEICRLKPGVGGALA